jgi:hypothetical protein
VANVAPPDPPRNRGDVPGVPSDDETRAATRLLAGVIAAFVLVYVAITSLVTRDGWLVRVGISEEVHEALIHAQTIDRAGRWGDRPVVWLVGSSILREAFDPDDLQRRLAVGGEDVGVEKIAFGRGAPLFTWALLDDLDVRPGDRVVTTVSYDNFRKGWLQFHGKFPMYLQLLMTPRQLFQIASLPKADACEFALGAFPPRAYQQFGAAFADGLLAEAAWTVGAGPEPVPQHPGRDPQTREKWPDYKNLEGADKNRLGDEDLDLQAGQANVDALGWWIDAVEARGAEPWVVFVPPSPTYDATWSGPHVDERFQAWMQANVPRYVALRREGAGRYLDYKHPNYIGRAVYTRELAAWLVADGDPARFVPSALGPVRIVRPE